MTSSETTQWDRLLKHVGVWEGSFTRLSTDGTVQEDMPTIIRLEGVDENRTMRQTNEYFSGQGEQPTTQRVIAYSSLGRNILFCEDGSFSLGSMQFSPLAEFGAEFGFVRGDRRLRLVQLFNPGENGSQFSHLTLIRERRQGTDAPERPPLTVASLLGEWQGEAVTYYPDWRSPDRSPTRLTLRQEGDRLYQQLTTPSFDLSTSATIEGNRLLFDEGPEPVQVLLLPDGGSCTTPLVIPRNRPFWFEAGWLVEPSLRLRLIRSYDAMGGWVSLTLVTERRGH
ncbi:MAG TPA: DUF3598 family protein [Synechococcales cyanobacterium M55_K2018_004]|nr:DUF3598 family protein [Synechococcales cyanobacterium M55_K2018_004]